EKEDFGPVHFIQISFYQRWGLRLSQKYICGNGEAFSPRNTQCFCKKPCQPLDHLLYYTEIEQHRCQCGEEDNGRQNLKCENVPDVGIIQIEQVAKKKFALRHGIVLYIDKN